MNNYAELENRIGFNVVRQQIIEKCLSPMGRRCGEEMHFLNDEKYILSLLRQTAEMKNLLASGSEIPVAGLYDISPALAVIKTEGGYMSPRQLFELKQFLETVEKIKRFFVDSKDEQCSYPQLKEAFSSLMPQPSLIAGIDGIVNKYGEVKDTASPALADIRRSIASAQAGISSIMRSVIASAAASGIIDKDTSPTMRDGRLVLPVAVDKKRAIPGIVQDESASGRTAYIEPARVVEAANRLKELEMAERREIIAILINIASEIRPHIEDILHNLEIAGIYDFIRAKALYAFDVDGQLPHIHKGPGIEWYHAVHPVLLQSLKAQGREVVPMNLLLNDECRILIISGPNAGGKSVALKTTGIVQYMAQCGVLPTIFSNSHMGIFRDIFIDIGDDQSIENDLSTYSSHLKKMKHIMATSGPSSLILIDEMGSGTEPNIGGALAQAILQRLHREKKCYGIITTHYHNLKTFAEQEEAMQNGAMLYDRRMLRPLFQLETGIAGSSFALEISRNIGLPADVIEEAQNIVGSDYVDMEKYLLEIARDRRYWANKRLSIKEKSKKIETLLEQYEQKADLLSRQRGEILADARQEAQRLLADVNARIENTIHEIRKAEADKERTKAIRRELEQYKKDVAKETSTDSSLPEKLKMPGAKKKKRAASKATSATNASSGTNAALAIRDYVKMEGSNVAGKIMDISGKEAEVAFGGLRMRVALKKLTKTVPPKQSALSQPQTVTSATSEQSRARQLRFKPELDLRGMRADEALQAVTYFIDDAVQFNYNRLRILHGTGTGVLKTAIRQYLNTLDCVKSFADEDVRLGGAGITVVEL